MTKIGWWTSQPKVLILGDCDHAICAWQASSLDLLHDDQRGCFNDLTKRRLSMAAASDTFVTTSWKFQGTQNLQRKEPCKGLIFKPRKKKTWFWACLFLKCLSSQRTPYKFTFTMEAVISSWSCNGSCLRLTVEMAHTIALAQGGKPVGIFHIAAAGTSIRF